MACAFSRFVLRKLAASVTCSSCIFFVFIQQLSRVDGCQIQGLGFAWHAGVHQSTAILVFKFALFLGCWLTAEGISRSQAWHDLTFTFELGVVEAS